MDGRKEGNILLANISLAPSSVRIEQEGNGPTVHCRVRRDIKHIIGTRFCSGTKEKVTVFDLGGQRRVYKRLAT